MSKPRCHLSIDLETLGKKADSKLLAIGLVAVCETTGERRKFYSGCSVSSQPERTSVQSTLDWWAKQSAEARVAFDYAFTDQCPTLTDALNDLITWIGQIGQTHDVIPWGNGANFDLAMLEHAFQGLSDFVPWNYRNTRDMRTLHDITSRFGLDIKGNIPRTGTHHHALDDAEFQANIIMESLRQIEQLAASVRTANAIAEQEARA